MNGGIKIDVEIPPEGETAVFRTSVADDVVRLLADASGTEFTIPEMVEATGASRSTVWRAVNLLESVGVVRVREAPQRNYVSVRPESVETGDSVEGIPQPEFREPVLAFVDAVRERIAGPEDVDRLLGGVVFGSVARGEADRRSDVDVFVVVEGDRTSARRLVAGVAEEIGQRRFDGDRFAFDPSVETDESAIRAGSKLREVFVEGVTVERTDELDTIRKAVLTGE